MIYRIDEELARQQGQWFVFALILFAATIVFLRDHRVLERYRYVIAATGIVLLLLPRVPGTRRAGERCVPRGQPRRGPVPAGRVRKARDHHLPRELPQRQPRGAPAGPDRAPAAQPLDPARGGLPRADRAALPRARRDLVGEHPRGPRRGDRSCSAPRAPVAQALRAAAARLGPGDGDARVHPGPRLVAHVLRRLPGPSLRRHVAAVVRGRGAHDVPGRGHVLRQHGQPRAAADRHLARPVREGRRRRRGLPDRAVAVRAGRRRACSARASASALLVPAGRRRRRSCPRPRPT